MASSSSSSSSLSTSSTSSTASSRRNDSWKRRQQQQHQRLQQQQQQRLRLQQQLLVCQAAAAASSSSSSSSSSSDDPTTKKSTTTTKTTTTTSNYSNQQDRQTKQLEQNQKYIQGLLENLGSLLDKYILTGSNLTKERAHNVLTQVQQQAMNPEQWQQAVRMATRAGLPAKTRDGGGGGGGGNVVGTPTTTTPATMSTKQQQQQEKQMGDTDAVKRRREAQERREWEASVKKSSSSKDDDDDDDEPRNKFPGTIISTGGGGGSSDDSSSGRSALSRRSSSSHHPAENVMLDQVINSKTSNSDGGGGGVGISNVEKFAKEKQELQKSLVSELNNNHGDNVEATTTTTTSASSSSSSESSDGVNNCGDINIGGHDHEYDQEHDEDKEAVAARKTSELVAAAGAGKAFDGSVLGIGGLDDVLREVKRRIWVPLAAPPTLLTELGIHPVRGLLLYGKPGCGKTLIARRLGQILSPIRPITVVSGPEVMDKFVGSSEKNLRAIFDNPPEIYDSARLTESDNGKALEKSALHVVIMDEFDAMARERGGRDGKGDQGDAGVARDSVVNQLLAKMDGVDELKVPTLVIGLTNKRSLIDPALLRPGRFEVQIEVPPPRTLEQRKSILKVHMDNMFSSGRILVSDAPAGSAAARRIELYGSENILTYEDLVILLATECEGMSGASIAGVTRAAASRALERAVCDFSEGIVMNHNNNNNNNNNNGKGGPQPGYSIDDCLVTQEDLEGAVQDVYRSSGDSDSSEEEEEVGSDTSNEDADDTVEDASLDI